MRNDASRAAYEMYCACKRYFTTVLKLCPAHSSSRLRIVCEPQWTDIHGTFLVVLPRDYFIVMNSRLSIMGPNESSLSTSSA